MISRLGAALGVAIALVGAGSASATVYTITFNGTVFNAVGSAFGLSADELNGAQFTSIFNVDTSYGTTATYNDGVELSSSVIGHGVDAPIRSAYLTINNITFEFGGTENSGVTSRNDPGLGPTYSALGYFAAPALGTGLSSHVSSWVNDYTDGDYAALPIGRSVPSPEGGGIYVINYATQGQLNVTSFSVAVPEPGTWALMIMGFGGIGATLRRRRMMIPSEGR